MRDEAICAEACLHLHALLGLTAKEASVSASD